MSRWFRMYDGVVDDPKVQLLPAELFRAWVNILCIASRHNGTLPGVAEMAFILRKPIDEMTGIMARLIEAGLIDETVSETVSGTVSETLSPHNWEGRQSKSDLSTDRVRNYRKRLKSNETVSGTVSETDIEENRENRIEREREDARAKIAIPDNYLPNDATKALNSKLGFSEGDLSDSTDKMRAWALADGVLKSDWDAAHQNWLRGDAEKLRPRAPPSKAPTPDFKFYAIDTPQYRAWKAYLGEKVGKYRNPRDTAKFGWHFEAEWPPTEGGRT